AAGTRLPTGNNQTLSVTFTPNDANYKAVTKTVSINVLAATATITWNNPADITYGTLLSNTQLNATADVAGTFAYTPAPGTNLPADNHAPFSVTSTPNDANYKAVIKTVSINVLQAAVTITWRNPADITYGTLLSTTQLNATADVAGTFAYTPAPGTKLLA